MSIKETLRCQYERERKFKIEQKKDAIVNLVRYGNGLDDLLKANLELEKLIELEINEIDQTESQ